MAVAPPGREILRNQGFGIGFPRGRERVAGLGKYGRGAARPRNPPKSRVWARFSKGSGEGGRIREIMRHLAATRKGQLGQKVTKLGST